MKRASRVLGMAVFCLGVAGMSQQAANAVLDTTPPTGTVVINNNRSATNNVNVTLTLTWDDGADGSGVARMRFSDNGSTWTAWETLKATRAYTLPAGPDGHKTVRVQFLDKANNRSTVYYDYIRLDTTPPTGVISINGGAVATNNLSFTLDLLWDDGTGAQVSRMRFSDDGQHWTLWEPVAGTRVYTHPSGPDGYKTVRVQYLDGAGNYSVSYSDYIRLDTVAPTGTIIINGGAELTNNPVTLGLSSSDNSGGSGVADMRFSEDGENWTEWEARASSRVYTMTGGDGYNKPVRVQYRDRAGNLSDVYTDDIRLDATPPTGHIIINDGAATTSSLSVTLALTWLEQGVDPTGVVSMRFSPDGSNWTDWETLAAARAYTLPEGLGFKTVRVQYQDLAGNISPSASDYIKVVAP